MKILLVGSSGGHLYHLWLLKDIWNNCDRAWVTFEKKDATSLLANEKTYFCHYPTNKNIKNLIKNYFLAKKILRKEKPDIIISSGAGAAIPYFLLGKRYGAKRIFIEVYDRIDNPTITGKICYRHCELFITQWDEQKKNYPKSKMLGEII
jgi:beta-1,4-N-acetylglucosaminyltransferase